MKLLCNLLEKDTPFDFNNNCLKAFKVIKKKLTTTPIIVAVDWDQAFEIMCDARDYAI